MASWPRPLTMETSGSREAGPEADMEFAYQIKMYDPEQTTGLVADVGTIPGVSGINLLVQNEDEEI